MIPILRFYPFYHFPEKIAFLAFFYRRHLLTFSARLRSSSCQRVHFQTRGFSQQDQQCQQCIVTLVPMVPEGSCQIKDFPRREYVALLQPEFRIVDTFPYVRSFATKRCRTKFFGARTMEVGTIYYYYINIDLRCRARASRAGEAGSRQR